VTTTAQPKDPKRETVAAVGVHVDRTVRLDPKRAALADVVKAWESLEGGRYYGPHAVEAWLAGPMLKAINKARRALKA
jgi:hypothetical protein